MLGTATDDRASAIRLTFPSGRPETSAPTTMVLAGCAEAIGLDPRQVSGLQQALASQLSAALTRNRAGEDAELSIELDYEPDRQKITLTAFGRTATTTSCDQGGPDWTPSGTVHPIDGIRSEFAGATFVQPVLPRAFARAALEAGASPEAVINSVALGVVLADAALEADSEVALDVSVHAESDSLEISIRAPSRRVLSGMATEWPGIVEWPRDSEVPLLFLRAGLSD